jgi:CRISPR-associated protein Csm4
MKTYQFRLKPLSSWATPWHADTLFAALAWQVSQRLGVDALHLMLDAFADGRPPFVLSDALPEGWFPCPLTAEVQILPNSNLKARRPQWISEDQFRHLITQPAPLVPQEHWHQPIAAVRSLHACIDRSLGTTAGEGNLFETEGWHLRDHNTGSTQHLIVYVRTVDWLDRLHQLFRSLSAEGFGKRKTVGQGAFELTGEPQPCEWLDGFEGANAFVSLSHFVPAPTDPTQGRWSLLVKYPKFSPRVPAASPFKGRLLMFRPGSAFHTEGELRPFYGTILRRLSNHFPEAVHYALAFPVPMRWPED